MSVPYSKRIVRGAIAVIVTVLTQAIERPTLAQVPPHCQQPDRAIAEKESLRQTALKGNREAQKQYDVLIRQQGDRLHACRQQTWTQAQATWIRLYPCDLRPGVLDAVLDRIVNRGYNQVYVEAFSNGQAMLPANGNPTPWRSLITGADQRNVDLLAQVIRRGHDRGLKVYAWLFTLNVGRDYFRRSDRQQTLARNGLGQTSLSVVQSPDESGFAPDAAFVDPYSLQARQDYAKLIRAIAQRKPDGILLDYVRYPFGSGGASVAGRVQDLWVYGESSRQVMQQRALNDRGQALIQRYLNQGYVTVSDVNAVLNRFPKDGEPMWQGRAPGSNTSGLPIARRAEVLTAELWQFAVFHAAMGVVDFVKDATAAVKDSGVPIGVVFFPDGNQRVGDLGYDSRLQFWEYFSPSLEWHPMAYATCGRVDCIVSRLQRVLAQAPRGTQVKPVLAGIWQESIGNRPPLETQMQAIRQAAPSLKSVSHFAYSWQEPASDRDRKFCR